MRLRIVIPFGLLVVIAATGGAGAAVSPGSDPTLSQAYFVSQCAFSHFAKDDPIRFPKQPGRSHNHTFFGNKSTRAGSTLRSLHVAPSTCDRNGDRAAYWVPTLFSYGRAVKPVGAQVYYRRVVQAPVRAFPKALRLIAGNMAATKPQSRRIVSWWCNTAAADTSSAPPTCAAGATLELRITFPSCWDGKLGARDDVAHVTYASAPTCPSRFPIGLPSVELVIAYPRIPTAGLKLASGGVYSAHADFINAWQADKLAELVELCLNEARGCGRLPPSELPPGG